MSKEYYSNYKTIINELTEQEKSIRADLESYKSTIDKGANTRDIEDKIKNSLKNFKDTIDKLADAYSTRNAPANMPDNTLSARQTEIKKFEISYNEMSKQSAKLNDDKYSYKDQITEDYRNKEEYKNMGVGELMEVQDKKLQEQEDHLGEIIQDVKKGDAMAKNLTHELKDQNKKIEVINEDMDRVDSRMNKITKRFQNYVAKSSVCCLGFVLALDIVILGLLIWIFTNVCESGWGSDCKQKKN